MSDYVDPLLTALAHGQGEMVTLRAHFIGLKERLDASFREADDEDRAAEHRGILRDLDILIAQVDDCLIGQEALAGRLGAYWATDGES